MKEREGNLCRMSKVIVPSTNLPACTNPVSTINYNVGSRGFCSEACKSEVNKYSFCTFTDCNNIQDKTIDRRGIFCTGCWGEHENDKRRVCKWCQVRSTKAGWQCSGCCNIGDKAAKEKKFGGPKKNGAGNKRISPSP